jgi:hypothetical protein
VDGIDEHRRMDREIIERGAASGSLVGFDQRRLHDGFRKLLTPGGAVEAPSV